VLAGDRNFSAMMSLGIDVDKKIDMVKALIEKAKEKTGSKRPVYISFDEYSGGGNTISYRFPAHSFTQFEIPVK
jgi:hypothetical protein